MPRFALFDLNLSGKTHNLVVPFSVGNQLDQDLSTFFHLHPVFSRVEVIGFLADRGTTHPGTVDSLLRHHVGRGHILRVRQGLYASVPPGATPETAPVDPFLLASRAQEGAVIAYHSALEVHGLAYSTYEVLSYVALRPAGPWMWRGLHFRPAGVPLALVRQNQARWGVVDVDRQGLDLAVTGLERTFVDVLDRPDLGGGWEEIWRSLESVRVLDPARVAAYVRLLENANTAARVGFFLEQHREALRIGDSDLRALEVLRPKQVRYLDRKAGGRLAKRWNLVVPDAVLRRAWEEP